MLRNLLVRRDAYRQAFTGPRGRVVLADLERFCHARTTTHVVGDTHGSAQLEGRRQVWLRIQAMLRLDEEDIEVIAREAVAIDDRM